MVNETIDVLEAPVDLTIRLLGPPLYVFATDSDGVPLPVNYNDTHASMTVYSTGEIAISYYTLNLTSKTGDTWTLTLDTICTTIILLPENSVPVSMEPTPSPAIIGNATGFEFPSNTTIKIEYYVLPSQFIPTNTGQITITETTTETTLTGRGIQFYYIIIILIILIFLYFIYKWRRPSGEEKTPPTTTSRLDDRDQKIIEALKSKPLSAPELMHATGIPKTPLYRRLKKLVDEGIIEYYEEKGVRKYRLRSNQ